VKYRDGRTIRRKLVSLAASQGGYFTAQQAAELDFDRRRLGYHVDAGNFERAGHGVYRVVTLPTSEHDDLIRLSLWSRGRNDEPQAVVSHESALALHDLSEIIPGKVHLTVPRSFRKRPPRGCVLHKSAITAGDTEEWNGFRITTPLRTLTDAATSPSVPQEQLERAVEDALERGLVRKSQLSKAQADSPVLQRLSRIVSSGR